MKINYIIPIFIPHRGCPHDCVFCNQKKITGLSTDISKDEIINIIEERLNTIRNSGLIEIAFFGGSFTGLDISIQSEFLNIANEYKKSGKIDKIRLSTRPDYINAKILNNLKKYKVDIIELGIQSLDKEVLESSNRGHSIEDVYKAVKLIKSYKFELGLQMMTGLVKDNYYKSLNTTKEFIKMDPDFVRIYPTLIIKDTYLETLYNRGEYKPFTLEDTIDYIKDYLMLFKHYKIPVIRIGLQITENISFNKDVVAGPLHPSIRQKIESKIYKEILKIFLIENDLNERFKVEINSKKLSQFVGHKGENLKLLKTKYRVKIIENKNIENIQIIHKNNRIILKEDEYIEKYLKEKNII